MSNKRIIHVSMAFATLMCILPTKADARIVINEIMFKPVGQTTTGKYEFIELYNTDSQPINIGGYILTDSLDYSTICSDVLPTSTSDNEGFVVLPNNLIIGGNSYFLLAHSQLPGLELDCDYFVYNNAHVANVILADAGDQVTLLKCENNAPVIIDSFDYSSFAGSNAPRNLSLERLDPSLSSQDNSNWAFSIGIDRADMASEAFLPGGTPCHINSHSCAPGYFFKNNTCVLGDPITVGTYNQYEFDEHWQNTRYLSQRQVSGFEDMMESGGAIIQFSTDLGNAIPQLCDSYYISNADDSFGLDSVDVGLIGTHGGLTYDNSDACMCMKQEDSYVFLSQMRLGNNARGLSLLATWACELMSQEVETNSRADRWRNIFSGGLKYAVGFWGSHVRYLSTDEDGEDFAEKLIMGWTIKNSFRYAMEDWLHTQEPSIAATGRYEKDCSSRIRNMTLYNMHGVEKLSDGNVNEICFIDFIL